jgi:hypothetical protein
MCISARNILLPIILSLQYLYLSDKRHDEVTAANEVEGFFREFSFFVWNLFAVDHS